MNSGIVTEMRVTYGNLKERLEVWIYNLQFILTLQLTTEIQI